MKLTSLVKLSIALSVLAACNSTQLQHDAAGIFESDEIIVSSEEAGKLLHFAVNEGDVLAKDSVVAFIDAVPFNLQKKQVEANIKALGEKTIDVKPEVKLWKDQIAVLQTQLANLLHEKQRIESLLKSDAATTKQLDDINFQIEYIKKQIQVNQQQIAVRESSVATQNRSILSEVQPLEKQIATITDKENRTKVINPINGTVLTKYAMEGEITGIGKALYKIADLTTINLRAYVSANQLAKIKLGQQVKVFADDGTNKFKEYFGKISWISDKAEFTPKTIQTKDERANLVYAIKIIIKNDGFLKIGMYGEVDFVK